MTLIKPNPKFNPKSKIKRQESDRTVGQNHQSILIMFLVTVFLLGGVGTRLAYLQIEQGERNLELAEGNRIRTVPRIPIRGNIFDRKGRILATTDLSYAAYVWPLVKGKEEWPAIRDRLSEIIDVPATEIDQMVEAAGMNSTTLVKVASQLTPAQMTAMQEYRDELQGIEIDVEPVRRYPQKKIAAHILGYTGELNAEELAKRRDQGYRLGDVMGKMGVEASLEYLLRGEWGGRQVEVDRHGRIVQILGEKEAKAGQDVTLTIDIDVQRAAEAALGRRKGAIVALDPNNGAVLALASTPTFDPNIFSGRITPEIWREVQGQGNPFVNRAVQGFPPASTFKVVTATAGMESEKYSPSTVLGTYGFLSVGGVRFHEWNKAGFGPMGFVRAMAWSSNTFFGQIGRGVGGPVLIDWSRRYGFGSKTGIELPEESGGLIADEEWKKARFNWEWTAGDTINMSIGQGFTLATPLQVAVMFAVPANGGYKVKPHLLKNDEDQKEWRESLNLKPGTLKTLQQSLRQVVTSGTGGGVAGPGLPPIAGKSGTAEVPPRPNHAWFGAYAPYGDRPEIVVVAFAEHTPGGGGKVAAPMVRQVLQAYFNNKNKK
jgi:penicillin-binding protein 2